MAMDDFQRGWITGIIEGEGWIGVRRGTSPEIRVTMTDEDTVRRCLDYSGVGTVVGPTAPREGQVKATWHWGVTRRDDAAALLVEIAPHLSKRRAERAREVLDAFAAAPPTRGTADTCSYGHDIRPGSGNLRLVMEGKYQKRRCLKCQTRRQREHRARQALNSTK